MKYKGCGKVFENMTEYTGEKPFLSVVYKVLFVKESQ